MIKEKFKEEIVQGLAMGFGIFCLITGLGAAIAIVYSLFKWAGVPGT